MSLISNKVILIFTVATDKPFVNSMVIQMNKKITLNGIELSLPKYNATAVTLFDYLDDVVTNLEKGLGKDDGNFKISIDVNFSTNKPPKHKIYSNSSTNKRTKEKVSRILKKARAKGTDTVSGTVRVNLQVEDR